MLSILLVAASVSNLSCPKTQLIGWRPGEVMTFNEVQIFNGAKLNCGKIYKQSPCVKRFIKKEVGLYRAICGPENTKV